MATEKQIEANKNNALQSTGAVTEQGKTVVSKNAVKHGIFAKDLIISNGLGREDEKEYQELLDNLTQNLNPNGQMESLLVEKIAVDFWRLRRVLRFEAGSIRKYIATMLESYYKKTTWDNKNENKPDSELEQDIKRNKEHISWNNKYIKCLKQGIVKFDNPSWDGQGLESDIEEDLYMVFDEIKESSYYGNDNLSFDELKTYFKSKGFTDKDIADKLIKCLKKQNEDYKNKISELEEQKRKNKEFEELSVKLCSLPMIENAEKLMRYEKSIQKSIIQNLVLLKKLQGLM